MGVPYQMQQTKWQVCAVFAAKVACFFGSGNFFLCQMAKSIKNRRYVSWKT
jgi:hypothetical protein